MNNLKITLDLSKRPPLINTVKIGIGDRNYPDLTVWFNDNGKPTSEPSNGYRAKLVMKADGKVRTVQSGIYQYASMCRAYFNMTSMFPRDNWQKPCKGIAYVVIEKDDVRISTQRFEFEILDGRNA